MEFKTPKSIKTTTNNELTEEENKQTSNQQTEQTNCLQLNYKEPDWSGIPENSYKLTVIKDGREINSIDLNGRSRTLFGRLDTCNVQLEHPTVSRYHAVLQYKPNKVDGDIEEGFYLYDLGSTHGCRVNKNRIPERSYIRVRTGHLIRFGESTRLYILECIDGYQAAVELEATREIEDFTKQKLEKEKNLEFISWGIETETMPGKEVLTEGEKDEFYKKDPKKYLKDFFEREGLEMYFDSNQLACGKNRIGFTVRIKLPLDDGNGGPLYAEVTVEGKKRDAIKACALEACRLLDLSGILRDTQYVSSRKRKSAVRAENDYYSSDEDSFLDRTGELENKRDKRICKAKGQSSAGEVETYSTLHGKLLAIHSEITELEQLISETETKNSEKETESQDLEEFMKQLNSNEKTKSVSKMKFQLSQLRNEESKISQLESIVKPAQIFGKPVTEVNTDDYGLKLAPENRKQEYLKKTTTTTGAKQEKNPENLEVQNLEKKKIYSVQLPPYIKDLIASDTENNQQQQQQQFDTEMPEEAEYIDWLPPTNQSGDGISKLNDEFGY